MFKAKKTSDAVSPVIGVILLVAVTVALVALATVIVFDIGSDVSDTADATVQLEQQDNNMTATVIRNENVKSFTLSDSQGSNNVTGTLENVGDTASIDVSGSANASGSVSVIATLEDGSEEVLTSTDYNGVSTT
jgi:flagellin-like protein